MTAFLRRLALLLVTMLLVTALAFAAFTVIPADPTASILGMNATDEQIAALRAKLGLDLPLWQRYTTWLTDFVRGNFGTSYRFSMPVEDLLRPRVEATLALTGLSFLLIVAVSLPLGLLAAHKEDGVLDRLVTVCGQVTMSIPNFILGIGVIWLFALILGVFQQKYVPPEDGLWAHIRYLLFPALAVALPKTAMTVRLLRGSVLGELRQDYVRTAYSKGNAPGAVLVWHVLRNAMIPVVTFLAMTIPDIMAASIVIEQLFGIPGLGQMLISSIGNRDYPVVQAIVVIAAFVVVACSFLADLLYRLMDPRIGGR